MRKKAKKKFPVLPLILGVAVLAAAYWMWQKRPGYDIDPGVLTVEKAFHNRISDLMVQVDGRVVRILETHDQSERYQEFVIRLSNGQSVLVSHDKSRADHVPLSIGDTVLVRGDYLWTENGGTIRYTYRDNSTRRRHGWIDHQGIRYQ